MSSKTIEHYLANPDELPTDLSELEEILSQQDSEEAPQETEEAEVKEDVTEASSGQTEAGTEETKAGGEPEAPIASKDGKHTIPYAVLASEREKRVAAERMQQELMARMQEIESRLSQGQSAVVQQQAVADLLDDESSKAILEDFPSLEPLVAYTKQLEKQVEQFDQRFKQVEELEHRRLQEEHARVSENVRQEIDANPHLRFWEQQDPERWNAAIAADDQLRNMPINQKLSMRERFEKVVAVVEAVYGKADLPEGYAPKATTLKPEKVDVKPLRPKTLGEMPGGEAPKGDDLEGLLEQSAGNIAARLDKMTPAQINSLIARLG
jgi:hypothetical protein